MLSPSKHVSVSRYPECSASGWCEQLTAEVGALRTPQRLHELAEGLGYWAARYQVLPGSPTTHPVERSPRQAMQQVRRVHGLDFDARGSIVQHIKGLDHQPEFASAIDLVDTAGDLSRFLSELTQTCAELYLANQRGLIAFVHTITAPSARCQWRHTDCTSPRPG